MISKASILYSLLSVGIILGTKEASSQDNNWTHFRGSSLNGVAAAEKIPLQINDAVIKWKTGIHDNGYSSPVVYDNQIWVTTAKPDGKEVICCLHRLSDRKNNL